MGRVNYGPYIFDRKVSIALLLASCSIYIDHGYKLLILIKYPVLKHREYYLLFK
jgi:hypothetical protein